MHRWLVALLFVSGCGGRAAAPTSHERPAGPAGASPAATELPPRAPEDLAQQVSDFAADAATPPRADAAFVLPPREDEIEWITDATAPLQGRIERAMGLFDDSTAIMKRYGTRSSADSAEALLWSEAVIRVFGRIVGVMVDEVIPALSETDPQYASRMEGISKMHDGAFAMLQASIDTLKARRSPLDGRRRLAAVWRLYGPRYAGLWQAHRCAQLNEWIRETIAREDDPGLRGDLEALATALGSCRGRGRDG